MKKRNIYLLLGFYMLFFVSCKNNSKNSIERNEIELIGKKITYPLKLEYLSMKMDTITKSILSPYRILLYTDSVGCLGRKLNLLAWKRYLSKIDSIMPGRVDFVLFAQLNNKEELKYELKNCKFEYPVIMDLKNEFCLLNKLSNEMGMQCFLLDSINQIISVGNPTLNPQIGELYKRIILSSQKVKHKNTIVSVMQQNLEIDNLVANKGNICEFTLKNVGHELLHIAEIETTCDCTQALWSRKPVLPGEDINIKVEIFPDSPGYLCQSLFIYCNVESKVIELTINGIVK